MEKKEPNAEDRTLKWIAGVMGFELHHESEYFVGIEPDRWWFMSRPFPRGYTDEPCTGRRTTISFYTQSRLLNHILESKTAFMDAGGVLRNPFRGMSRDEIALSMAVAGA